MYNNRRQLGGRSGDPRCRINTGKTGTGSGRDDSGGTNKKKKKNIQGTNQDKEEADDEDFRQLTESDLASAMTPEELAAFRLEGGMGGLDFLAPLAEGSGGKKDSRGGEPGSWFADDADMDYSKENDDADDGTLTPTQDLADADMSSDDQRPDALRLRTGHPSLVSWLKDHMAGQGTPIRGGKYWRPVAGAVDIDDSGFVVLCPKDKIDNVHVDFATYVAVVGNSEKLAPRGKIARERLSTYDKDGIEIDIVSKLRTGRGDDNLLTAAVTLSDGVSSTSDVVRECQSQFDDGIRGDPSADPLDRRASRRLLHCGAISVSSLIHDDDVEAMEDPPDDVAVLSERGEWGQDFVRGSYLGRTELRNDEELTTAYREINGAADGYPGWVVDRYGQWLSVQHDEAAGIGSRGPLPSIHDENTVGVYYFPTNPDRSTISTTKPILLEGQAAPDVLPIKENGITYHVNLEEFFSTGIFLDQRPQRAWLARHCDSSTRVLNCFAHCVPSASPRPSPARPRCRWIWTRSGWIGSNHRWRPTVLSTLISGTMPFTATASIGWPASGSAGINTTLSFWTRPAPVSAERRRSDGPSSRTWTSWWRWRPRSSGQAGCCGRRPTRQAYGWTNLQRCARKASIPPGVGMPSLSE